MTSDMLVDVDSVSAVRSALAALDRAERLGAVVDRDVTGFVCEGEQPERSGRRPTRDATAVARLRAAGAVVVAKTQPGADHAIHGRCHHPFDATRTPGGTSSGEAALIGCGASTLGLGSDSGGSIRLPAAWCGVVGLKPSFGLVPTTGHFPRVGGHVDGRTVIGPMATTVADVAAMLGVIAGPDGVDPSCCPIPLDTVTPIPMEGLRIAVVDPDERWPIGSSTAAAVDATVACLVDCGAVEVGGVERLDLSESLDITQRYWRRASMSGAECEQQLGDWDRFASGLLRSSTDFDVIIGPVVADVAPLHRELIGEDYLFTLPWSLTGWPAISLPFGVDPATGLPLAVQIVAPRWRDDVVLATATVLE